MRKASEQARTYNKEEQELAAGSRSYIPFRSIAAHMENFADLVQPHLVRMPRLVQVVEAQQCIDPFPSFRIAEGLDRGPYRYQPLQFSAVIQGDLDDGFIRQFGDARFDQRYLVLAGMHAFGDCGHSVLL